MVGCRIPFETPLSPLPNGPAPLGALYNLAIPGVLVQFDAPVADIPADLSPFQVRQIHTTNWSPPLARFRVAADTYGFSGWGPWTPDRIRYTPPPFTVTDPAGNPSLPFNIPVIFP